MMYRSIEQSFKFQIELKREPKTDHPVTLSYSVLLSMQQHYVYNKKYGLDLVIVKNITQIISNDFYYFLITMTDFYTYTQRDTHRIIYIYTSMKLNSSSENFTEKVDLKCECKLSCILYIYSNHIHLPNKVNVSR